MNKSLKNKLLKKANNLILLLSWWTLLWVGVYAHAGELNGVQIVGKNQLVFQLTTPFKYHYFSLSSPERLVIDFDNTLLKTYWSSALSQNLPIQKVRSSLSPDKTLRIVLDLKSKQFTQVQMLPAAGGLPWRLLVTFNVPKFAPTPKALPATRAVVKSAAKPIILKPLPHQPSQPVKVNAKATYKHRLVTVVIDPGHGGKDPGAHGKYGTREKDVVLGIARQLQYLINRQPGMHAVLTRNGDYYIDLRQRLTIARKDSADIFVSIHADAFSDRYSHGASVYALSERGGTSEAARWLAAKENYSELGGVDLGDLDDKDGMVRSVLIDLSQTATIGASLELGSGVLSNIGKMTHLHYHSVEQAQFVVLKSPDIPSILVETGFISNPQEEAQLRNPAYQAKLARSILQGIQHYFVQHPPVGSYWIANA